jgi:hypothetical protein
MPVSLKQDAAQVARFLKVFMLERGGHALDFTAAILSGVACRDALLNVSGYASSRSYGNKSVVHHGSILSTSRRLSLSDRWLALACRRRSRFGSGYQALASSRLAGKLARAANSFPSFAHFSFRRLFIGGPELHLAEDSLALHFFLQELQRLVNVVVADGNEQNISNLALANRSVTYAVGALAQSRQT